jgi:hypothetical protein
MRIFIQRRLRQLLFGRDVIIVSGLPRSGTSMMMKMLASGGLPLITDDARSPDEANPFGYFEHERVKSLPTDRDTSWLRAARGKGVKIVSPLLRYLPTTLNYRVVLMERDVREIAASQNEMLKRAGESTTTVSERRLLEILDREQQAARDLLQRRARFVAIQVQYEHVLHHPQEQAERVASFLDCNLRVDHMASAVDHTLYRNRAGS